MNPNERMWILNLGIEKFLSIFPSLELENTKTSWNEKLNNSVSFDPKYAEFHYMSYSI